jgi:hypothetical protein
MRRSKAPGPSGIRVKDLLYWHRKRPEIWHELVLLVQDCYDGKPVPQAFSYEILCLLPKPERGKFRGIVLLEVIYKLVSMIIHIRIENKIHFHPALHGFLHKHGTGTCILEAKLQMQLASYLCQPLYQILLDLTKAYDTLDRERSMSILEAYGIGLRTRSIIALVWEWELAVPKSGGCFGKPFSAHRGVRQGDVISPVIFNIVVDAVVREWYARVDVAHLTGLSIFFYADDGHMACTTGDAIALQQGLDIIIELFQCMGLEMNDEKTKAMIFFVVVHFLSLPPLLLMLMERRVVSMLMF